MSNEGMAAALDKTGVKPGQKRGGINRVGSVVVCFSFGNLACSGACIASCARLLLLLDMDEFRYVEVIGVDFISVNAPV
jgi:hypothetical protein